MAILGIDYGKKRIGLAKTDELMMFAHPLAFISNDEENKVLSELRKCIEENNIDKIVVGMPVKLNGKKDIAADNVESFINKLRYELNIEVLSWDERLTSKEASRYMHSYNVSGKKKRKKVDGLAAQIMLQSYIDAKS